MLINYLFILITNLVALGVECLTYIYIYAEFIDEFDSIMLSYTIHPSNQYNHNQTSELCLYISSLRLCCIAPPPWEEDC